MVRIYHTEFIYNHVNLISGNECSQYEHKNALIAESWIQGRGSLTLEMNMIKQESSKVEMCEEVDDWNERLGWIKKIEQERSKVEIFLRTWMIGKRGTRLSEIISLSTGLNSKMQSPRTMSQDIGR